VAPIVDQLATDYAGKAKVGKVDVDSEGTLAQRYNIASIPTIMVFKNGEVVEQIMGARPKPFLASMLDKHL
jgi:thioredoxin 1